MNASRMRAELIAIRARVDEVLQAIDEADEVVVPSPWMKPADYAEYAQVSIETVRRWVKAGMPHAGSGKLVRIERAKADTWRSSNTHSSSVQARAVGS